MNEMILSEKMKRIQDQLTSLDFFGIHNDEFYEIKNRNIEGLVDLLSKAFRHDPNLSTQEKSYMNVIYYLFFVEGLYSYYINMIIYYEICKRHCEVNIDYGDNKGNPVKVFDELYDVHLSKRLKILRERGYQDIADLRDKKIRNAIAHNDFVIDKKGAFIILSKRKKINYSTLEENIKNLQMFMALFNTSYLRTPLTSVRGGLLR